MQAIAEKTSDNLNQKSFISDKAFDLCPRLDSNSTPFPPLPPQSSASGEPAPPFKPFSTHLLPAADFK